jgi:cyclopropane fatty-acyl-phospholipid synthase-like methyltransferase
VQALPHSEACERNKGPILEVLRRWIGSEQGTLLEIGSGTGQHAVHFARHLPRWTWQPTEQGAALELLAERARREGTANLLPPFELDVMGSPWPRGPEGVDAIFTANTLHIMSWPHVQAFFRGVGAALRARGWLIVYGPFRYGGAFTTPSNEAFDAALRARDPDSGLRDVEAVIELAAAVGLQLVADEAMPANNQALVWRRTHVGE